MLVVPGEGQSQNPSQEVVSDISTSAPITVPDVSSTSSDLVTTIPEANIEEDEDDEPPVIIDVMINTSQGEQLQPTSSTTTVDQNLSSIPHDELSNTSTISATESLDSTSKPKCTLNDLIKALSDSLEQDQEKNSQMSVMMSPALQYFNLAQATALQTDPGLSGIPSTVTSGTVSSPRGRGRGRGRGNGRGRGRRKTADVSPEMPELTPEAHQKSDICYDNLPDSTDSENEGPPRITKILPKRSPKDKSRAAQTKHSPAPPTPLLPTRDEPFIPSHLTPQTKVGKAEGEEEEVDDASNQAIHVTVKMYEYNGKTMYKCTECGKSFTKTCTFARHAMLHSKMYPYQCGICDMKCGDMRILLRHLDQHAEDADCPCQKCERMNKDFHIETHKKVSTTFHFKCNLCGKKFFSDYACKIHVNAHKRKLTLTCEQCKLEFRCNRILSRHRKAVHDVQYCPVCLETCSNLISHMQQHIGFTLYRCGLCGDGFNSRPHLHDHLKIHTQLGTTTSSSGVGRTTPLSGSSTPRLCPSPIPETSSGQGKVKTILMEQLSSREDKEASDTLVALSCGVGSIPSTISGDVPLTEMGKEQLTTVTPDLESNREQSPNLFIVRTGEYEDEAGEIDVHVIPRTRRERFQSKSKDDKDISIEPATPSAPKRQISRRCRWHGNDSLCERCDDNLVKKVSSNRKRRGSATRGRRGSKSPRSDYSDTQSLRLNSDSLDSLKNLEVSLPLANYILKGGDDTIIELSD